MTMNARIGWSERLAGLLLCVPVICVLLSNPVGAQTTSTPHEGDTSASAAKPHDDSFVIGIEHRRGIGDHIRPRPYDLSKNVECLAVDLLHHHRNFWFRNEIFQLGGNIFFQFQGSEAGSLHFPH